MEVPFRMVKAGRIETGIVRFNGDWPGVFIRGDEALGKVHCLKVAATLTENILLRNDLLQLAELFESANSAQEFTPVSVR